MGRNFEKRHEASMSDYIRWAVAKAFLTTQIKNFTNYGKIIIKKTSKCSPWEFLISLHEAVCTTHEMEIIELFWVLFRTFQVNFRQYPVLSFLVHFRSIFGAFLIHLMSIFNAFLLCFTAILSPIWSQFLVYFWSILGRF